jgi:dipeptidyl aminopeptidase/acylaminoacyl peptidase
MRYALRRAASGVAACFGVLALGIATHAAEDATASPVSPGAEAATTGARRPLEAFDWYRVLTVSDPTVSPDGAWVAYIVTRNDRAEDAPRSALWMVSWDGRERLALTNFAAGTRAPRFSPDGRYLSFLRTATGGEHTQLLLLDRRGGEPRVVYETKDDLGAYAWSPDGGHLALSILRTPDDGKAPRPIVVDALHFKQDEDGYLAAGARRHLELLDLASETLEPLTHDAEFSDDQPVWSPDGSRIAFVRTHGLGVDDDGREAIDVIEAHAGAAPVRIAAPFAPNAQKLAWSPDGTLLAYLQGREPKYNAYIQDRLVVVPAAGGTPRSLSDSLDRAVMSYVFAADGRSLTAAVEDDRSVYPVRIELDGGAVTRLQSGAFVVSDLTSGGGHTAMLYSDDGAASEVFALEPERTPAMRKLSAHNDALLAELALGATEDLGFKSRDGTEIHGLIVLPPGYVAGKRYPALLWIHGGPNGQDEHSLAFDDYEFRRQMLAAAGYVVVGINYRGSSGRGFEFADAIRADWGHKEVEDLLAGVDAVVARGLADPNRLGIGGWSYGGLLTDYTIASDRRFKAAASGAGSANQLSMYGMDQYVMQYNAELGPPWRNPALWLKVSYPFFHADRIRTPTLFMGGDKDFNVPIAGGEQLYEALRTLGVPAELVVYPGEFHSFKRPSFLVDRQQRVTAWFDEYLGSATTNSSH